MVPLIAGLIAFGLGVTGLIIWIDIFWAVVRGTIPALLILGGLLALYLGYEEIKDRQLAAKEGTWDTGAGGGEDVAKYKQEVEELKAKLAKIEAEKEDKPAE